MECEIEMQEELCKYNLLAVNRGSPHCMKPIKPRDGRVLISADVVSAEPNILLNLSLDSTLYEILCNMKGKKPFWNREGLLITDSLYITLLSKTSLLNELLTDQFIELYAKDSDAAKATIKKRYKLAKSLVLSGFYGATPGNPKKSIGWYGYLKTNNYPIEFKECQRMWYAFWDSMPDVKALRDNLEAMAKEYAKTGKPLLNPLGFPIPSSSPRNALNYTIQSSVSSFIRKFLYEMRRRGYIDIDECKLVAVIHDEVIVEVKEEYVDRYRKNMYETLEAVNLSIGFKFPMGLGFNIGRNFYDIH